MSKPYESISAEQESAYSEAFHANPLSRPVANALNKNALSEVAYNGSKLQNAQFQFSIDLPTLEVTDQKQSGRCWIFAGLNVLRERVAQKCNLEKFELSQNYIAFWDKFEKINYFLSCMIELADRPLDDRVVSFLLSTGLQDGGQWDMFVNVVEKYGVVPKDAMDETYQSCHTRDMIQVTNAKLREYTARLRALVHAGGDVQAAKQEMLSEMYGFLCMCFGEPPASFDFEYVDKDKKYHIQRSLTAKQFYKDYVGMDLVNEYVSVINAPTDDKPFGHTYTVDYLGNVAGGRPVCYLNLPMDKVKSLIVRQLQDGEPVWFGSDVGHQGERERGIWSDVCFDYAGTLGMPFRLTKAQRLDYRESAMNHAMVITGVSLDADGAPTKWKIQNSWSDKHGDKGYYQMGASWFDTFVYQAVIHKKYLTKEEKAALLTQPKHLSPWDPMGTLAD